jgi:hypothetical protein
MVLSASVAMTRRWYVLVNGDVDADKSTEMTLTILVLNAQDSGVSPFRQPAAKNFLALP